MIPVVHLFGLELPAFGIMLSLGFVTVHLLLRIQARRYRHSFARLHTLTLVAFAGGSIGARLFEMLIVERRFSFSAFFQISQGTFFYGFLIGVILSCWIYYRCSSCGDPWKELSIAAPAWLAMQVAGRVGCFLAGCCYGTPTDLPWGVSFHAEHVQAPDAIALHPTQLYEAIVILLLLCYTFSKRISGQPSGYDFLRIILLYAVARFFLEFLRADERGTLFSGALSTSQGISLVLVAATLMLMRHGEIVSRSDLRPIHQQITKLNTQRRSL